MKKPLQVIFKGKTYTEPFHCLCCGRPVSPEQFAFGRACGTCDCGLCQLEGSMYWHPPLEENLVAPIKRKKL